MALLNTIYYTAAGNYQQLQVSSSTKRELEALGIDPSTVASESQARQIIEEIQQEESLFEQMAQEPAEPVQETQEVQQPQAPASTETGIIAQAKILAEQLGIPINENATYDEIKTEIFYAVEDLFFYAGEDPELIEEARYYQLQLIQIDDEYNAVRATNSGLYSAMDFQANNTRYMLGL